MWKFRHKNNFKIMTVKTFAQFSNKTELNLESLQESCNCLEASTNDKFILDKIKAINALVNDILNYTPKVDNNYSDNELITDDEEFIEDLEEIEFDEDEDDELIDDIEDDYLADEDEDFIEDLEEEIEFDDEDDFIEDLDDEEFIEDLEFQDDEDDI